MTTCDCCWWCRPFGPSPEERERRDREALEAQAEMLRRYFEANPPAWLSDPAWQERIAEIRKHNEGSAWEMTP